MTRERLLTFRICGLAALQEPSIDTLLVRASACYSKDFAGQHIWACGYFVSTVGRDEEVIREYSRRQEEEDARLDQLNLWK